MLIVEMFPEKQTLDSIYNMHTTVCRGGEGGLEKWRDR